MHASQIGKSKEMRNVTNVRDSWSCLEWIWLELEKYAKFESTIVQVVRNIENLGARVGNDELCFIGSNLMK